MQVIFGETRSLLDSNIICVICFVGGRNGNAPGRFVSDAGCNRNLHGYKRKRFQNVVVVRIECGIKPLKHWHRTGSP